jgi:hypothetical protein
VFELFFRLIPAVASFCVSTRVLTRTLLLDIPVLYCALLAHGYTSLPLVIGDHYISSEVNQTGVQTSPELPRVFVQSFRATMASILVFLDTPIMPSGDIPAPPRLNEEQCSARRTLARPNLVHLPTRTPLSDVSNVIRGLGGWKVVTTPDVAVR